LFKEQGNIVAAAGKHFEPRGVKETSSRMTVSAKPGVISGSLLAWWGLRAMSFQAAWLSDSWDKKSSAYNVLWIAVFGFATLNILSLVGRRFEPNRNRLSFGETLAIMVVILSIILLGWEMLYVFHVLPIQLSPR
jgi:hypothetical protein